MSGSWNNQPFQPQGLPGGVKLFDPTQFQTPMSVPSSGAATSDQPVYHQPGSQGETTTTAGATNSSWNSWGNWGSSWDWNGDNTDAGGGGGPPLTQQPQQGAYGNNGEPGGTPSASSSGSEVHQQQNHQFYQAGNNEVSWNQGWEGSGMQQQYPAYDQPGAGQFDQQLFQQNQWDQQMVAAGDQQSQYAAGSQGQQQAYNPYYNASQQEQMQHQYPEQQQQQQQFYQRPTQPESSPSPQQTPQQNHDSSPPHQQHQQFHNGGVVNNVDQGQQMQYQQQQAYYDQPYDANAWNSQWGGDSDAQGADEAALLQPVDLNEEAVGGSVEETVPSNREGSQPPVDEAFRPEILFDNDNDGTVSGFFGRGDDDGDIAIESPRLGSNRPAGNSDFRNQLPVLQQSSSFHRTHSEISNASLATLNYSTSVGDGDEDGDPLHHVQELVQRMEETHLAQSAAEASPRPDIFIPGDGVVPPGGPVYGDGNFHQSTKEGHAHQDRGDYSGFGCEDTSGFIAPGVQPSLPIDSADLRPASPDGDDHAGSGGSGASGGSSGLTDWEIVPSQASSGKSHSRNSSLDNGVSGGGVGSSTAGLFPVDKPDGGMISDTANNISAGVVSPVITSGASSVVPLASSNVLKPAPPSLQSDSIVTQDPTKSMSTSDFTELGSSMLGEEDGRSGVPPQSASQTDVSPSPMFGPGPPTIAPQPPQPQQIPGAGSGNPFRRDVNKSPRQASLPLQAAANPTSSMPPPPAPATPPSSSQLEQPKSVEQRQKSAIENQPAGLSALPSRPKLPSHTSSSTDDGIPARRREPAASVDDTNNQRPPNMHSSAFHPVSRAPRRSGMSPASSLWEQSSGEGTAAPSSNILLAPAMPLIIPALNPYSSAANSSAVAGNTSEAGSTANNTAANLSSKSKEDSRRGGRDRRDEDPNRSIDSLDEIDSVSRDSRERSFREQREREERYRREADRGDRPYSRADRPHSRAGQYHYDRDRPSSRADGYGRDDPYRRNRGYYRDYGDMSYDERYDRPRSRQDENRGSRPTSRSGQPDTDRPRSRANYDRDRGDRDYYGRGVDRHRGYGYDQYARHADYYDERERYYRYYKEKEARYARGYYEEYYGVKHAERYMQQQQQQQQQSNNRSATDRSSNHSRQSRGNTPAVSGSRGNTPAVAGSRGNTPAMVGSRGNTPGITGPSPGPDYYGRQGSRPASRADYSRDYYHKGYDYSGYYYDGYGYDPYAYGYAGYHGYEDSYNQSYDQGRLTPPKHSYPHVRACFGSGGQLVKVLPNRPTDGQPATVELQDVQTLLQACPEAEELKQFPGPLTWANTHKKDVLLFCQQKARQCAENVSMTDRESAQLIWRLLELLIKQNGSVVGTDLSDLLLEGHEPSTHEYALHGLRITHSQSPDVPAPRGDDDDEAEVKVTQDRTVITPARSADAEREASVDRFRHLLLYGRKKDALDCAMKNHLWGHALFLASKMDARTHASVMTRFANSAMRMNDPLQTLYQLMSNRQPAAVTCVSDERWGDWRPHLAMMLSNQTSRSDLDRKSICTLGDTLASKGYLHASHFCYLMAQVNLGTYFKKTSKIVLIGSSHTLPMDEFATIEAIQCTEVYEYAQLLGNPAFCLPHFQMYKYLYACQLADYGMAPEALHYCEVISTNIQQYPAWFKPSFVKLVHQLASKLKFSDPQRLHTSEDAEDPAWIQQLQQVSAAFEDGSLQPMSGTVTPANVLAGTSTSSESGDYAGYYGNSYAPGYGSDASGNVNAVGVEGYQAQQPSSGGYYSGQQQPGTDVAAADQSQLGTSTAADSQQHTEIYQQNAASQQVPHGQQEASQENQYQHPQFEWNSYTQQWQQATTQQATDNQGGSQYDASSTSSNLYGQGSQQQQDQSQQQQPPQQQQPQLFQPFPQGGLPPRASITTDETIDRDDDDDEDDDDDDEVDASASGFDYFGNVSAGKVVPPPHRYRTQSGSSSTGGSGRRRRTTSGSSTGSVKAAPSKAGSTPASKSASATTQQPTSSKKDQQQQQGSGWFGGLKSMFGRKGKNEMILPDDSNPSIIWDAANKKWVNSDGSEIETHNAPPPPTDSDLLGGSKPPTSGPPSMGAAPPPAAAPGANRFSRRATGARNNYVDVNNPKPLAVPSSLFNVMPPSTSSTAAPPQVYMPGAAPPSADVNTNNSMLSVPDSSDQPAPASNVTAGESSASAAPGMPMLFNPASLKATAQGQGSAGAGAKRRVYPKK